MVKVEELNESDDGYTTDDNSVAEGSVNGDAPDTDASEGIVDLYDPDKETLGERLYALRDMVSPSQRAALAGAAGTLASWTGWAGKKAGNAAWIVTTSALLVVLPLMLTIEGEVQLVQQEMAQGQYAQQSGAQSGGLPQGAGAAGIVPPGF